MSDPSPIDPRRLARASLGRTEIKRFYKDVSVGEGDDGFSLRLDGRVARTPTKNKLVLPTRALADVVAAEWAAQGATIEPFSMPATRIANSAIDGVSGMMDETREEIARYGGADLLCYRALEPESLATMQAAAHDPVLLWAAEALGARFILTTSVLHVAQPAPTLAAVRDAVFAHRSPFAVAALSVMTSLSGSAVLALAVARGAISPEAAWRASHVDEDFQIAKWGEDEEAAARREGRWREFEAAAQVLRALE